MVTKIYEKMKKFIKGNLKELIIIVLLFAIFTIELPYSIYTPGGAVNLNDRITIDGEEKVEGSFNMAYVSMVKGSIPFLLLSKVLPDWDIVEKEKLTLEGEDLDELLEREKLYLQESIDNAVINAYRYAGKELEITKTKNQIIYIAKEAKTDLKIGDEIIGINDVPIESLTDLKNYVSKLKEGEEVTVQIRREDEIKEVKSTTFQTDDGVKIGVSTLRTYEYETSPNVEVKSKSSEAGSSGGFMMSLEIYNKLTEEDITKGKKIVGTGTIDVDGNVGEIGGVKYKLIGAVNKHADVFLCPEENYEEAINVAKEKNYNIKILSAKTFEEGLAKLKEI